MFKKHSPELGANQRPQSAGKLSDHIRPISGIRKSLAVVLAGALAVFASENARAFKGVELKYLKFLDPTSDNLAPSSKDYPKTISPDQRPYLWPCDDVSKDKDKFGMDLSSPSLVFDVAKRAEGSFRSVHAQNKDRLRLLGVLRKILDAYQIDSPAFGAELVPDHQKRLKQLNDLYTKNLESTQALVALWEPLHKAAAEIRQSVKQLVMEEARVGKRAEKCAKPQALLDDALLLANLPENPTVDVGDYMSYDSLLPRGMVISPYVCANLSKGKLNQTDSELYLWLDFFEKVMTEHVFVSMDRQRSYIENADRLTGAVGTSNEASRSAFNSVLAVQGENQRILDQWKQIIVRVQALKAKAFEAVNQETRLAKKLKRCMRREPPRSSPDAGLPPAQTDGTDSSDVDVLHP